MDRNHMLPPTAPPPPPSATNYNDTESTNTHYPSVPQNPHHTPVLHQYDTQTVPSITHSYPPAYSQAPLAPLTGPVPDRSIRPPHNGRDMMLPPLSSVTGGQGFGGDGAMMPQPHAAPSWPTMNSIPLPPPTHLDSPAKMDLDNGITGVMSPASIDRYADGRAPSVNLDDPDVRLAAEALGDLRADFVSSPPSRNSALPMSPPSAHMASSRRQAAQQEPLFSLLTTSHPFLATTIGGASSAYGGAKNYSPRFKSGAEYVENYLTPLANTVGSVGRVTGVEGSVRWFLGAGRRTASSSSDLETSGNAKKRRKVDKEGDLSNKRLDSEAMKQLSLSQRELQDQEMYAATPKDDRRLSLASTVDTLPAYDEQRSPAYTETADSQRTSSTASNSNAAWQSRLVMSTSGLGVAMSDESLRSLKYCLRWLRWANDHMGGVIGTLKTTLDQYDQHEDQEHVAQLEATERQEEDPENPETAIITAEQSRTELAARINVLKGDVLKTLQDVITTVSKYAGGALPENARVLVRRHLTSLPQRFRVATMSDNNGQGSQQDRDTAMREGAQKVLVLAKEGLDMVSQVSGVLDGTIVSAEEWCERMGKKRSSPEGSRREQDTAPILPQIENGTDVKMG